MPASPSNPESSGSTQRRPDPSTGSVPSSRPDAAAQAGSTARNRRPRLLNLAYALLPLCGLLLISELALWLAGVDPGDEAWFSRGFDPQARYLVPAGQGEQTASAVGRETDAGPAAHTGAGRAWVTRIFDGLHPEVIVPPKGPRRRLLLMGGSNVRRLSAESLERRLTELSPPRHPGWEVINLGREGYGSERLTILLKQALVCQPDVVVIYTGHNEFIERRFARELDDALTPGERRAVSALLPLRTFRLLKNLLGEAPAAPQAPHSDDHGPEEFQLAVDSFKTLTWDGTVRYLEAFRRNLSRLGKLASEAGAQVVICTLVSNDLAPPVLSNPQAELGADQVQRLADLRDLSILDEPDSPWAGLALIRRLRWTEWNRDRPGRAPFAPLPLRQFSGRLAATPATSGPLDSIAGAHWTDPERWSMLTIECVSAFQRFLGRDLDDHWRELCQQHVQRCRQALAIAPDDPAALFDLGLCLWLLGQEDQLAVEALRAAAAHDRLPMAANDTINAIVRDVVASAAEEDIVLLDAAALFRCRCPAGLIGLDVMMDHCHLQPGAGQVLLQDVADAVLALEE